MSIGEVKPTQPGAVATATTWTARVSSIAIAAVIALQQAGLIAPQHAATIKTVTDQITPIADKIETAINDKKMDTSIIVDLVNEVKKLADQIAEEKKKDEQVNPKPEPTPIDVLPKPSPDQQRIKDMEEQIRKLLDELAKKHEPKPPEPVTPPVASIKVVDSSGKELTTPIEAGRQFKVVASVAGKWAITSESPTTDYDVMEYPDHLVCVLRNGAKLSIAHATEAPLMLTAIMVKCQDAPRPPPGPKPVDPVEPDDKKPITTHKVGGVYLVWEPSAVTPEQSSVIADLDYWTKLRASGVTAYTYLPTTADELGKWTLEQMRAKGIPPPAIVLVDKDRFLLDVVALPKSVTGVEAAIAKVGGK